MSLFEALKLRAPANSNQPTPPVAPEDDVHAAAVALKPELARQREDARQRLAQLGQLRPALARLTTAASGAEKAALVAKQAALEKAATGAAGDLERATADLEAIDHPATSRAEMVAMLARRKAAVSVSKRTDIDAATLGGGGTYDIRTTTTSYAEGKAKTEKLHDRKQIGIDGVTKETDRQTEVKGANLTARAGESTKTNLSLKGERTTETTHSREVELADGRKAGIEKKTARSVGPKGASTEKTVAKSNFDGSSSSTSRKAGIERGDGSLAATAAASNTKTNAAGTSATTSASANAGASATKDSAGASAGVDAGKTVTGKGGAQLGAKLSLKANIAFNVGKPTADTPPRYPVTLRVSFAGAASVTARAGQQKGSTKSASVTVEKTSTKDMVVTHMLTEAELGSYTKALQAAQTKGGKVADARQEFQVISAGVNHGWAMAAKVYESGGSLADTMASLKRAGDSASVKESSSTGAGGSAKLGRVGIGATEKDTRSNELAATRKDDGKLAVEAKGSRGHESERSGSVDIGAVNLNVGRKTIHETRFGFSFEIDPAMDPSGGVQKWLEACKTRDAYVLFYNANRHAVKLIGSMDGKSDAGQTDVGVGVGGVKAGIFTGTSNDDEVRRDGTGKVIGRTTTSESRAGGTFMGLADSETQRSVSETDAKGNSSLTLSTAKTSNSGGTLKTMARAAGIGKDTKKTDTIHLKLSSKELKAIGASVVTSVDAWNDKFTSPSEKEDWQAAGKAIKAAGGTPASVSREITNFMGQDIDRMRTVQRYLRGINGDRLVGEASEFPQELAGIADEYDMLRSASTVEALQALAAKDAPRAVAECQRLKQLATSIAAKIRGCKTFSDQQIRAEMLDRLESTRNELGRAALAWSGGGDPDDDPKLLAEHAKELMAQCNVFWTDQQGLFDELNDLLGPDDRFAQHDGKEVWAGIHKVENMQTRWSGIVQEYDGVQKKLGAPNVLPVFYRPNTERAAFYRKAMGG